MASLRANFNIAAALAGLRVPMESSRANFMLGALAFAVRRPDPMES